MSLSKLSLGRRLAASKFVLLLSPRSVSFDAVMFRVYACLLDPYQLFDAPLMAMSSGSVVSSTIISCLFEKPDHLVPIHYQLKTGDILSASSIRIVCDENTYSTLTFPEPLKVMPTSTLRCKYLIACYKVSFCDDVSICFCCVRIVLAVPVVVSRLTVHAHKRIGISQFTDNGFYGGIVSRSWFKSLSTHKSL